MGYERRVADTKFFVSVFVTTYTTDSCAKETPIFQGCIVALRMIQNELSIFNSKLYKKGLISCTSIPKTIYVVSNLTN